MHVQGNSRATPCPCSTSRRLHPQPAGRSALPGRAGHTDRGSREPARGGKGTTAHYCWQPVTTSRHRSLFFSRPCCASVWPDLPRRRSRRRGRYRAKGRAESAHATTVTTGTLEMTDRRDRKLQLATWLAIHTLSGSSRLHWWKFSSGLVQKFSFLGTQLKI